MRITASWSGSSPTEYKYVARMFVLPHAGLPSDFRHPDHNKRAVVLEADKAKPSGGRHKGDQP